MRPSDFGAELIFLKVLRQEGAKMRPSDQTISCTSTDEKLLCAASGLSIFFFNDFCLVHLSRQFFAFEMPVSR